MTIDTDWEYKANHYERETKRLILEVNNLKNQLLMMEQKISPFRSGGDWGFIKALIVSGAPDPEIGKNLARKITEAQAAIDLSTDDVHPVSVSGTIVQTQSTDFASIIADLEEAHGFAAMSPRGRDNIECAIASLEEASKTTYQYGFVDGEKHAAECLCMGLDRMLDEAVRRMSRSKILGFDGGGFPIDNPEYLPNGDTQIGVEFAIEYLRAQLAHNEKVS